MNTDHIVYSNKTTYCTDDIKKIVDAVLKSAVPGIGGSSWGSRCFKNGVDFVKVAYSSNRGWRRESGGIYRNYYTSSKTLTLYLPRKSHLAKSALEDLAMAAAEDEEWDYDYESYVPREIVDRLVRVITSGFGLRPVESGGFKIRFSRKRLTSEQASAKRIEDYQASINRLVKERQKIDQKISSYQKKIEQESASVLSWSCGTSTCNPADE